MFGWLRWLASCIRWYDPVEAVIIVFLLFALFIATVTAGVVFG